MDLISLKDLPLPLAVIIAAFWVINTNNADFAKKLVALIAEFTGKYEAILDAFQEDRMASRNRWLERDRILLEKLDRSTVAQEKLASETQQLRNMVQPLVLSIESDRKRARGGSSGGARG